MSAVAENLIMICTRLIAAALVAAAGGLAWAGLAGGSFGQKFGTILVLSGFLMMMAPSSVFTRMSMVDTNMWLGRGPDVPYTEPHSDRPTLTHVGVFLFVSIPLIAAGTLVLV